MGLRRRFIDSLAYLFGRYKPPTNELTVAVATAQKELLYRQLFALAALPLATATIMAGSLLTIIPPIPVLIWYLIYIPIPGSLFVLYWRSRKFKRKYGKSRARGRLIRQAEMVSLVSGVFWGSATPLFGLHNYEILVFMAVVQLAHACGLAQLVAPLPRMVFRFSALTLIPMSVILLFSSNPLLMTLGLLSLAVFVSTVASSFASYKQLSKTALSENRAKRAETLLRSAVDAMPDAFAVYDFNGALIIENSNHKVWPLDYPVPATQGGERVSQSSNGQWIKHSWNQVPEVGMLTVHSNITEQKQREGLLIETREQARNAKGAQSRFLSRISHELRTPLNSVLGFSELMQPIIEKQGSWAVLKEYTDYIHTSGQHLLSLVDDIIDYTHIGDDAEQYTTVQTIDLQANFKQAIAMGKAKAQTVSAHNILIRLHPEIRYLKMDDRILERIIANIISNAIKFSAPDSKITVSSTFSEDGRPKITIRDYGFGMTPEQVKNVFSVFYQADDTHKRSSDGTGMGLSVVKRLVELVGGEIEILSKDGRGTAVILTFAASSLLIAPEKEKKQGSKASA